MMALLYLALAFGWAWGIAQVEDMLPPHIGGFVLLIVLCVANPFLWLFFGELQ